MTEMTSPKQGYSLLILAGGAGQRMGGQDKGLLRYRDKPLIEYLLEKYAANAKEVLISANRHLTDYQHYGKTLTDTLPGFAGPLAGLLAGLEGASSDQVLVVPCDCPSPPAELYTILQRSKSACGSQICCAYDGDREQYLFALIDRSCRLHLQAFLADGGRSVRAWYAEFGYARADFSEFPQSFKNLNTPRDLQQ